MVRPEKLQRVKVLAACELQRHGAAVRDRGQLLAGRCRAQGVAWVLVLPALSCSVYDVVLAHISPEIAVHPIRRQAMCLQRVSH